MKIKKIIVRSVTIVCIAIIAFVFIYSSFFRRSKPYKIIMIPKIIDKTNDFWSSLIAGADMAGEEYGVDLSIRAGSSEIDYSGQNKLIEEAIKEKPDAILVTPCSFTHNTETLKKVKAAGIPLILIDSVIDQKIEDLVIASDNFVTGEKLGIYASSLIGDNDHIAVVSHVKSASTAIDRELGFRAGLGSKEANIYEVVYSNSDDLQAYNLTINLLKKYPDIKLIAGLNQPSAVGATRAIADSGLGGKVFMVGLDSSLEEIKMMELGIFQGIVIQKPFNMGYLGVEQTVKFLDGKNPDHNIDSGSKLITKANLYDEDNQKLLFPFMGN